MSELLVKLPIYEGPLDLLLHLIKKNEVDLNDIPLALITSQYLEYLDLMESLNVEVASDFLVMAATLTQIKSRLLLPREDDDAQDSDLANELKASIIDPLLEYLRQGDNYLEVAEVLGLRQVLNTDVFVRSQASRQALVDSVLDQNCPGGGLVEASLFDLVEAFQRLAEKKATSAVMHFVVEPKTLSQRLGEIQDLLKAERKVSFELLCARDRNKDELILSFLAVLELARVGFLCLYQDLAQTFEMSIFLANPEAEVFALADLGY